MIVAYNRTGIGSRIKCILGAMRMAEKKDAAFGVYWQQSNHCRCRWNDLFENSCDITDLPKNHKKWVQWRWYVTCGEPKIDWLFDKTPKHLIQEYSRFISILRPVKYIREHVFECSEMAKDAGTSVCLRTWAETRWCKKRRHFSFKEAFSEIDKINSKRFYFTTDSDYSYNLVKKRYGKRVLVHKKRGSWGDRFSAKGQQDILVDLMSAGHAKKMILSKESGFTEMQWWFGGCQADVKKICPWR